MSHENPDIEHRADDPFPLLEETHGPAELPTVEEWLAAGAPMREVEPPEWPSPLPGPRPRDFGQVYEGE
jgi:hypothetical protein